MEDNLKRRVLFLASDAVAEKEAKTSRLLTTDAVLASLVLRDPFPAFWPSEQIGG